MLTSPKLRLVVAAAIAAPLVYTIFLMANWLIQVKDVALDTAPQRLLEPITPQANTDDGSRTQRPRPKPLDAVQLPPRPPRDSATKGDIVIPIGSFTGGVPETFRIERVALLVADPNAFVGREIQAVRLPVPTIPRAALARGISGSCDVRFDVDTRGRPYNVRAACSDDVFRAEAERAVGRAEFLPRIVDGRAIEQRGAVYPLVFEIE